MRDALAAFKGQSFRLPAAAELLSLCVAKEKVTKEKGHPAWRLPPIHGRQVREPGSGFSNGHPARAKRHRHPCRCPLRGLSSPTHRRTGAPGRAAGHPGPHSVHPLCRPTCPTRVTTSVPIWSQKQLGDNEQSHWPSVRRNRHVRSLKPPHNGSEAISSAVADRRP